MEKLILINCILVFIDVIVAILCKKFLSKKKELILLIVSILTILIHYSSLLYHQIVDGTAFDYLKNNPNLVLMLYPCNIVMWACLLFALIKNKEGKLAKFLIDYIFWFGIISSTVGMFANVDFIRNPSLKNFDVTKGIISHGVLFLNSILLVSFNYVKIDFIRNMLNIVISVIMMFIIGLYNNLLVSVIGTVDYAYEVNSMFLIHSPFDGINFLTYPVIAIIALILYFIIFNICELIIYKKGKRWFDKIKT